MIEDLDSIDSQQDFLNKNESSNSVNMAKFNQCRACMAIRNKIPAYMAEKKHTCGVMYTADDKGNLLYVCEAISFNQVGVDADLQKAHIIKQITLSSFERRFLKPECIQYYNHIICEYMGGYISEPGKHLYYKGCDGVHRFDALDLSYRLNPGWIFLVIEKIEADGICFQVCRRRVTLYEDTDDKKMILSIKCTTKQLSMYVAAFIYIQSRLKQQTGNG